MTVVRARRPLTLVPARPPRRIRMPVRIVHRHGHHGRRSRDRRAALPLAVPAHPAGRPGAGAAAGRARPRPRPSSPRSPDSASCSSGRCRASPTSSRCGASRSCCSRSSRPTAASSGGLPHPAASGPALIGFIEDFFAVAVLVALVRLLGHPAPERPGPRAARVPLLRLAHRGGLAGAGYHRRGHGHPPASTGRPR